MSNSASLREAIRWARHDVDRIRGAATSMSPMRDVADLLVILADAAESTLPKTKEVEVWRVEYAHWNGPRIAQVDTEGAAHSFAEHLRDAGRDHTCIHVTGPHKQTVPA